MRCTARVLILSVTSACSVSNLWAQSTSGSSTPTPQATNIAAPLPDIRQLLLDVERHQKAAEALQRDYTYHVHIERQDFGKDGSVRKNTVIDAESVTLEGVRVDRVIAKDGKPLTPDEAKKEDERIEKTVAKARERRAKADDQGKDTNSRGDVLIPASRILELGTFTNPRRIELNGRPTIVVDYAGDPNAKTHGPTEGIIRDLVGTIWVDEGERTMVRGQGRFLNDFKIGGGLVANIHKGMEFSFEFQRVADEVWLPHIFAGEGSARVLLFEGINGRLRLVTSDYRKFRTGIQIIPGERMIGDDGQVVPSPGNEGTPASTTPGSALQPAPVPQP